MPIGNVFATLQSYTGSTYVNQFNLFNQSYQTYVQADSRVPARARGHRAAADPQQRRRDGAAGRPGQHPLHPGCRHDLALQPLPTVGLNGAAAPGFSSGEALSLMEQAAAGPAAGQRRLQPGPACPAGEDRRQPGDLHLRAVDPPGLPGPGRPLRELDQPHGGDPGRAAGAARRGRRHDGARVRQRHVLPDRHRADDRHGGQERDPGGRVRPRPAEPRACRSPRPRSTPRASGSARS